MKRKTHYVPDGYDPQTLCGVKAMREKGDSENEKKVTCKRCKKMLYVPTAQRWGAK